MAIGDRGDRTWAEQTTSGTSYTVPAAAQDGDRLFLLGGWKDQSVTATVSTAGWNEIGEFADGSVATGNGVGSMRVKAWYADKGGSGVPAAPQVVLSGGIIGAFVMLAFSKASNETWNTPTMVAAAITNWTNSSQSVTSAGSLVVPSGGMVIGLAALRDDSGTMTRPTNAIVDTGGIMVWNGNYVENPAAHLSTTTGNDMAIDAGYRLVTTGGTGTMRQTATISAAETGSALWIAQGVTASGGAHEGNPHFIGGGFYG